MELLQCRKMGFSISWFPYVKALIIWSIGYLFSCGFVYKKYWYGSTIAIAIVGIMNVHDKIWEF